MFSCHDITLYGLLHALGAQEVVDNWRSMQLQHEALQAHHRQNHDAEHHHVYNYSHTKLFWPTYGESSVLFHCEMQS